MKITVVVPIYNASLTIENCARTLFEQSMTDDVEFLFIDDCTPDNSVCILTKVIEDYPKLCNQIRILHNKKNIGVSQTRKRGIKEAKGDYIAWVDSDDWIEQDMLETMWNATDGGVIDVIVQNVIVDNYVGTKLTQSKEWKLTHAETPKKALINYHTNSHVPWGLPFQMSRRTMILDASEKVHDVNITEDAIALIYLFANAKSCFWLEKAFYHYVSNENSESLTHRKWQTKDEWNCQKLNVDDVTAYLLKLDPRNYKTTANYIKWFWKNKFYLAFDNSWSFWRTYRECYYDIEMYKKNKETGVFYLIRKWLKYNIFPLYWISEGRLLFSK